MKKFLFGILAFLGIGLSFCSADYNITLNGDSFGCLTGEYDNNQYINVTYSVSGYFLQSVIPYYNYRGDYSSFYSQSEFLSIGKYENNTFNFQIASYFERSYFCYRFYTDINDFIDFYNSQGGSSSSDIDVYYNNGNSTETITCDGTQAIQIDGLSTITSTNTFTPYFNIDYIDENNQLLTESYSKYILYLSGTTFKKTYTGNNERILTSQGIPETIFTGYTPVFDITGQVSLDTGNVFNNFADNSLKVLLSNIPAYIQYVTIGFILLFLFGFIRRFKKKR